MHDPTTALIRDRAVAILRDTPAVTVPLPELGRRIGTVDPDGLARSLAADPRLVILGPPVPGLALADRADDYLRALTAAGIRPTRRVALLHPTPAPAAGVAGVAGLLRHTATRLLAPDLAGLRGPEAQRIAETAERAYRAVLAITRA